MCAIEAARGTNAPASLCIALAAAAGPSLLSGILVVVFTIWYFFHFLVLTPLITALEAE